MELLNEEFDNGLKTQKDIAFLVISKKKDVSIGWGGLYNIDWIKRSAELRFFIGNTEFWKMTAALESEKLLLEYGFDKLNLHKITGGANVENKGSWKVIERVGFVKEGVFRDAVYRNGKYYDAFMYSILRTEYEKLYGKKYTSND
jgi:RimJ/RimL family protein N-acetyltransferase